MTVNRRLRAVGAILVSAAVLTSTHVWGEPSERLRDQFRSSTGQLAAEAAEQDLAEALARSKFAEYGVVTYRTQKGETLFALQVQPKLEPMPARPRDILVLVDTSASQANGPLTTAREIVATLAKEGSAEDRVAIWTANTTTKDLTRGFEAPQSQAVKAAVEALKLEVPLGDTDLRGAVSKAVRAFRNTGGRQQVILFLGDGLSIHNPIENDAERLRLCDEMIKQEIVFFSVPLGRRLDPANLHGLATGSGGAVVRMLPGDQPLSFHKRLQTALAVPVIYPRAFRLPAEVVEAFPTKLPPLRSDAPTLVVGKMQPAKVFAYEVEGIAAGREVHLKLSDPVPESEADNFFLVSMVEQWKNAKDQPALMRADRALAYAHERNQLARADLLAQAQWAITEDKLEAAANLFKQARQLDPQDVEAEAGLKIVEKLRSGVLTRKQLQEKLEQPARYAPVGKNPQDKARRDRLVALAQQAEKVPPPAPPGPPAERDDLLQLQKQKLAVEEQRVRDIVDDTERQARRLLERDPDAAQDLLKRVLADVQANPDLSDKTRQSLTNRLEGALRNVVVRGATIKRDQDDRQKRLADALRREELTQARTADEERTRRRMMVFDRLMDEARYEAAAAQALAVAQDAVNSGTGVPAAATAGYVSASFGHNIKEFEELKRLREERYLLTMMQVERSHMPFPDEPPIQYPPAAVWREITLLRKEKYESSGLADDDPVTIRKVKELREKLAKPINLEKGIDANTPLKDALDFLQDRYDLTILIDTAAFEADQQLKEVESQPVKLPKMLGVSLGTVLRLLLSQVNGTYLIRRDYIEVTTGQRATAEKTLRVYPAADLVIPIPNAINQQSVNQQLTILGTAPGIGLQLGSPLALGGLGALGVGGLGALGLGGLGVGGLGLGGLGVGGLGALGAAGGAALGVAGGGLAGLNGGFGGGLGFQGGQVNLGAGGGALGFGGGQLGQFGNLGGQFGLQGGDQSTILIQLIRQVIGTPADWRPSLGGLTQGPGGLPGPAGPGGAPGDDPGAATDIQLSNDLGYYPPALALVVKGTSRIHTQVGGLLAPRPGAPPGGMGALPQMRDGLLAVGKRGAQLTKPEQVAAAKAPNLKDQLKDPKARTALAELDPKKVWQEALEKGVRDPGLIIACTDFLGEHGRYDHVAEFLKATLRQGILVRPWVYEALALALEASGGTPEEIERARVSAVDLEPTDARGYLKASKAMSEQKRYDRALAYCRQAALVDGSSPDPYMEALTYAELARDGAAMEWAAGKLLRQDWTTNNEGLHSQAGSKLKSLAEVLAREKRQAEAERLAAAASSLRERDLKIVLSWQGEADLDLEVREPIGTACTFLQRQTPGGGILLGDIVADAGRREGTTRETYVAAKAFPGAYQITVRRIWGRPLGGKATVEIIRNEGTPRESRERQTILFDRSHSLTCSLADGRRTTAEAVPPPAPPAASTAVADANSTNRVLTKLRSLADPELADAESRMSGGASSLGLPSSLSRLERERARDPRAVGPVTFQTKMTSPLGGTPDLTARAVLEENGRAVRVSVSPLFQTAGAAQMPVVTNPLIPGSPDAGSR